MCITFARHSTCILILGSHARLYARLRWGRKQVGGDNASRGIAIGMVLGAYKGIEAIPKEWKETLDQWEYCEEMLNKLPLLK